MKINKKNPKHWIYLLLSTLVILSAIAVRIFSKKKESHQVGLYGHKLNGNLEAIYAYSKKISPSKPFFFLCLDTQYAEELEKEGINTINLTSFKSIYPLSKIETIVSDHGLHSLILLKRLTRIKFIDVWHGIPFKGFDKADFKVQHKYNEVYVTSKLLKQLYEEKFGFKKDQLFDIGYARTDILINDKQRALALKHKYKLPDDKHIWTFAPTWQQDDRNRNVFPFSTDANSFLSSINELAEKNNALCILRTHLNFSFELNNSYSSIHFLPSSQYPLTEEILLLTDILICDWSSIAFDFLLLNRPTIFLDTPEPFKKGFSLDKEYRFGKITDNLESLLTSLERIRGEPDNYWAEFKDQHQRCKSILYDTNADGNSAKRAFNRIVSS